MRLIETVTEPGYQSKQTAAFFLYVGKAFGHVWHEGVVYKLKEISNELAFCENSPFA